MPVGNNLNLKRESVIPLKRKTTKGSLKKKDKGEDIEIDAKARKEKLVSGKKGEKKKAKIKTKEKAIKKENPTGKLQQPKEDKKNKLAEKESSRKEKGLLEMLEEEQSSRYSIEIIPSKRKSVKKAKIVLGGELTIGNSSAIHGEVSLAFDKYEIINFSLQEVRELDLSMIQMLHAYKTGLEKDGKSINITVDLPKELKQLVQLSGFSPLLYPTRN